MKKVKLKIGHLAVPVANHKEITKLPFVSMTNTWEPSVSFPIMDLDIFNTGSIIDEVRAAVSRKFCSNQTWIVSTRRL
jgi:hypothetical protein